MIKKILKFILLIITIFILLLLYSRFIGTIGLITKEINVYTDIDDDFDGLKIVHFSDLHYKRIITNNRINDLVDEINLINPDIVVFTGDLIDEDNLTDDDIDFLKEALNNINSKYGKYSILGEYDYKINIDVIRNIYDESGFNLLENTSDYIYSKNNNKICIIGISTNEYEDTILDSLYTEEDIYKILLLHEPDYIDKLLSINPNLALAGHTHNGQVNIPLLKKYFLPVNGQKYYEEYYKVSNTQFYISSGIGVSEYNFRFNNTPSINFYRINKTED